MRTESLPLVTPSAAGRQLALPFAVPAAPAALAISGPRVAPRAVWRSLPEAARAQLRTAALRVLQEVLDDARPA